ncbi:hypothetical protein AQUCO_03500078v1 [Aquilegia coerulea]|uniref:Uncharacterized protein n=1 Tax=Aquilegia coerulea TaxID=218851 RepID=A0A2G5CW04_AQUCA|nr:hypothetical protein AQUCO_03500078v1 [Aquilegia coerulea]
MEKPPLKQLTPQEWESLMEDFQSGYTSRQYIWLSQYSSSPLFILDLALSSILKKDFPLKLSLIIFIEEFYEILIPESDFELGLGKLFEAIRSFVQAPVDGISVTYLLKEQMMISSTSIFISLDGLKTAIRHFESLTELLLTVINRPNHGVDRQTRAIACECLRELERAYPCLLADVSGHLWSLCQSERTHASQSYILLLTSVIDNLVISKINGSIISTTVPLVPFNVPQSLIADSNSNSRESLSSNLKEVRRVMAFLLERPQILTPCGMMEFIPMIIRVAVAIDLQASLLKVQFSSLLYSYDPMLCHVVLMLYSHFSDSFEDQEGEIVRRLVLISKEVQQPLVFRLLALHWLFGFVGVPSSKGDAIKKNSIVRMVSSFYPTVFDPLALKTMKLDMLAYSAICIDTLRLEKPKGVLGEEVDPGVFSVKLFEDGLVSVSAFKWLPPWSTETAVAFRTFHKFLIGATPHSTSNDSTVRIIMDSNIFHCLQKLLVDLALEFRRLVPVIVAFFDRQLRCHSHLWLGERLLQTFDEHLLPKLKTDYPLPSYFPIFNRIAENNTIPPRGLLDLLTQFIKVLVDEHGPDTGLRSWSQGNKVLGICRTMLTHHHSSRVFVVLSRLLAFTCLYFPDLEVRDNARIYLRMLICIPGKKLRQILNLEEQLRGISPSPHINSFDNAHPSRDLKKSRNISSYIHLERVIPLLVKQSWTLSISTLDIRSNKAGYLESIRDTETCALVEEVVDGSSNVDVVSETGGIDSLQEPLRVMDSKSSGILSILRRHFIYIPDFRYMQGLKIRIPCILRFESQPFNRIWGVESPAMNTDGVDQFPAMYAIVLSFSSSSPYGSIPSVRIPFLLGEPVSDIKVSGKKGNPDVKSINTGSGKQENFKALVMIEVEPREPMPGLVDVSIEANAENGQIIRGQLQSVTVGIEDMFLKAIVPSDIAEDAIPSYYSDLFSALWEACDNSSNTGRETFPTKGGKGVAAISGTRSVKLLEVSASSLIGSIERYLAPFVVSVSGGALVSVVKDGGIIRDIIWKDELDCPVDVNFQVTDFNTGPLQLKYMDDENGEESIIVFKKRNMGCFSILIFLPPRFHLLFQMEVCDISTLVRIRTDHWPCLAYIDDYLEALFLT